MSEDSIVCPYCKKPLGSYINFKVVDAGQIGRRWCSTCHFWIRADGQPDTEQREWLRGADDG